MAIRGNFRDENGKQSYEIYKKKVPNTKMTERDFYALDALPKFTKNVDKPFTPQERLFVEKFVELGANPRSQSQVLKACEYAYPKITSPITKKKFAIEVINRPKIKHYLEKLWKAVAFNQDKKNLEIVLKRVWKTGDKAYKDGKYTAALKALEMYGNATNDGMFREKGEQAPENPVVNLIMKMNEKKIEKTSEDAEYEEIDEQS